MSKIGIIYAMCDQEEVARFLSDSVIGLPCHPLDKSLQAITDEVSVVISFSNKKPDYADLVNIGILHGVAFACRTVIGAYPFHDEEGAFEEYISTSFRDEHALLAAIVNAQECIKAVSSGE